MKKIIAISLMALMILSMSIPMFAAYESEANWENVAFDVKKADMEIKLDGDFSEYDMHEITLDQSWMTYAVAQDDQLAEVKSISTPLYMAWDDTYLYIGTYYKPATFSNTKGDDAGNIWQECAIQVNVSSADASSTDRLEYGIGITSDTNAQVSTVWANREGYDYKPEGNFAVVNDGGTIKYETRIAWTDFLTAAPKEGDKIGVCIVWAMGVGSDHAHKQLAAGCTGDPGKSAENFATVTLVAAPERPVEIVEDAPATTDDTTSAPVTTTPATTVTAAQTSDATVYLVAIAVISLAAVIVISKKIKA